MAASDPVPAGAVLPEARGITIGCAVLGAVFLGTVMALSNNPGPALIGGLIVTVLFGPFSWFFSRGRQMRIWVAADRAVRGRLPEAGPALRRGLVLSVMVTLVNVVLLAVFVGLWGLEEVWVLPGIVLGLSVAQGLGGRDLRRWQEANQVVVCRRVGARRVAWTGAQTRGRLVLVPSELEPDAVPSSGTDSPRG